MDLRTKLVFALVGVSLVSMAALGSLAYTELSALLQSSLLRQMDALAASRKQELEGVIDGWDDRVRLIGSRTRLRVDLARYADAESEDLRGEIARILGDAGRTVPLVRSLDVYDNDGRRVASAPPESAHELPDEVHSVRPDAETPSFLGIREEAGVAYAHFVMPLSLEQEGRVGWLEARLSADEIAAIAADTTGLGVSGETLIVARDGDSYRVLHPTRNSPAERSALPNGVHGSVDPADLAAAGVDTMISMDAIDYRGQPVWAATRHLDGPGWGIVVKVDTSNEFGSINAARRRLIRGALAFAAFGILAGILLAFHLARPIHDLAEVANRIREGDTAARATIHHRDEIGMLARTFNRMADALTATPTEFDLGDAGSDGPDPDETAEDAPAGS